MIDIETFTEIRKRFSHFASWAVWPDEGTKPKDRVGELEVLDPNQNPNLLKVLHAKAIFLGLNISRPIEEPFANFHDRSPKATDFKIRYALKGTDYLGSYMTDIIKGFEETNSRAVMTFLKNNRDFLQKHIKTLREEFQVLGASDPILVTFGRDAETLARHNLSEFRIVGIPHYANYISKEQYREQVCTLLPPTPSTTPPQSQPFQFDRLFFGISTAVL